MGLESYAPPVGAVGSHSLVICSTWRRALARSAIMFDAVADGAAVV